MFRIHPTSSLRKSLFGQRLRRKRMGLQRYRIRIQWKHPRTHRWRIRTQRFLLCRYCRRPLKQKHQRRPRFESYGFTRWNQRKTLWSFLFENLQNRSRSTRSHRFHLRIRSLNGSHPRINRICHRYVLCPLHSLQSHQSRKIIKWQ